MSRETGLLGDHLRAIYEAASFGGDPKALDYAAAELQAAEAQLSLARGRFLHARYLTDHTDRPEELDCFMQAARLFHTLGDTGGEADATFWVATYHQVVRHDEPSAVPLLERAQQLAAEADDPLVMSYVERHLAFVDASAGRLDQAKLRFEESLRLRRQIGFVPGVAAALLPLVDLALGEGDASTADRLLAEVDALCGEHELRGVERWAASVREKHDLG